ncbi:MAG TPA: spore germination protein GerW family protein, partial [Acidimicrobiales bacterium]
MDLHALLSKATDTMNVGRAFGSAYERGDKLIIPVAFVAGGGGGGAGEPASATQASASAATSSQGQGMGGGFGTVSWPMGVYVVTDDSVRWVP